MKNNAKRSTKVLLLVLDGLADTTLEVLGWKTPLQAAHTPILDGLASEGAQALLYPLGPGICPSSEVAHWSIFGYEPSTFPGRTYFHALHFGIKVAREESLFTANVVRLLDRDGGPLRGGIVKMSREMLGGFVEEWNRVVPSGVRATYLDGDDILLAVRMGSCMVHGNDPFIVGRSVRCLSPRRGWERHPKVKRTLSLLTETLEAGERVIKKMFCREGVGASENIGLVVKWPSRALTPEPWSNRHGMEAGAVVSTPCFSGMAAALGMRARFTGSDDPHEDLVIKLREAEDLFEEGCEFVFVHTKHADEAGHTGDPMLKVKVIEEMDRAIGVSRLVEREDLLTVITCDHSTPTLGDERVIHGGDPVPILFHGGLTRRDGLDRLDEVSAARGGYGRLSGGEIMALVRYLSLRADYFTG